MKTVKAVESFQRPSFSVGIPRNPIRVLERISLTGFVQGVKYFLFIFSSLVLSPGAFSQDTLPVSRIEKYVPFGGAHFLCIPVEKAESTLFSNFTIKTYRESEHTWLDIPTGYDSLLSSPLKGYSLLAIFANPDSCLISFSGALVSGPQETYLSRTWNPNGNPPGYDGWNLQGNPFPSASDWESTAWNLDNIDPTLYYFDGINYKPYNRVNHLGNGSGIIPSGQGFFLHVTDGDSGWVMTDNSSRVHSLQPFYKGPETISDLMIIEAQGNNFSDETFVHFDPASSTQFDSQEDAYKLFGITDSPQIFNILPAEIAAINVRPFTGYNTMVPLGFRSGANGQYWLIAHGINSFQTIDSIYLEDKLINTWQNLTNDSVYSFTSGPGDDPGRFVLHFDYSITGIGEWEVAACFHLYSHDQTVFVSKLCPDQHPALLSIYDMRGQRVFRDYLADVLVNQFIPEVSDGYYLTQIFSGGKTWGKILFLHH